MQPAAAHITATLVVILHVAFVVFVVFGGFVAWRWRKVLIAHVPAALWGVYVEWSGTICPLTPIENALRSAAGLEPYGGDFVARYLFPVLYPAGLTREVQLILGVIVVLANAVAYGRIVLHPPKPRQGTTR